MVKTLTIVILVIAFASMFGTVHARYLKTLVIVPSINPDSEFYLHAINPLDGLGYSYDIIDDDNIMGTDFIRYSQIVVIGHSMELLDIDWNEGMKIVDANRAGADILWVGNGIWMVPYLPENFGINFIFHVPASSLGVSSVRWTDISGNDISTGIDNEYIVALSTAGASAEAYFKDGTGKSVSPAVTVFKNETAGRAVFIAFDPFIYWKQYNNENTWDRAELFIKYLRKTSSLGEVTLHPYPNAKRAVFSVRFEDVTPSGTNMEQNDPEWVERFNRTVNYLADKGIPSNIALVPVFAYPFRKEYHYWNETSWNGNLRSVVERALRLGGSIIGHGYTHQNGNGRNDYSGDDNEMYDEDKKQWLTLTEQIAKTTAARAEILKQFGLDVKTWETPHYLSDENTYRAAKTAGFSYASESDTKIYPNYYGYLNKVNKTVLMIPETAFDFPEVDTPGYSDHYINSILPRMEKINGNFFIFYHNNIEFQYNSLVAIVDEAVKRNFWFPNVEEYASYTEQLKNVKMDSSTQPGRITATIGYDGFIENLTIKFRLPEKRYLGTVLCDETSAKYETESADGIDYAYVVLNLNQTATIKLYINSNLTGDADGNCRVNVLDLALVGIYFGQATPEAVAADMNKDGNVNVLDLAAVGKNFGKSC